MRVEDPIPLDDSLPEENVYRIEAVPIAGATAPPRPRMVRSYAYDTPWFRHYANYLAAEVEPPKFFGYNKKKILREVKRFYWDEPYL